MGIARELAALAESLRTADLDVFAPIDRSGLLDAEGVGDAVRHVREAGFDDALSVVRLCLQALRVQHGELTPHMLEAELVATLPPGVPGMVRPTRQVLHEMLRPPVREAILLGYQVTDETLMALLVEASSSGADVVMILDRERGAAQKVLEAWPPNVRRPDIYHDRKHDGAPFASMHAKCLLVDASDLLITSANFTFHGLHGNIEIGVRLQGSPAAEARKVFSHLVESGIVRKLEAQRER